MQSINAMTERELDLCRSAVGASPEAAAITASVEQSGEELSRAGKEQTPSTGWSIPSSVPTSVHDMSVQSKQVGKSPLKQPRCQDDITSAPMCVHDMSGLATSSTVHCQQEVDDISEITEDVIPSESFTIIGQKLCHRPDPPGMLLSVTNEEVHEDETVDERDSSTSRPVVDETRPNATGDGILDETVDEQDPASDDDSSQEPRTGSLSKPDWCLLM